MHQAESLVESRLRSVIDAAAGTSCPPKLAQALEYAVFPSGHRVRPKLCLAIAAANNTDDMELAVRAAISIELLHCASLVHDDMPCFDNSEMRRNKPSVHVQFGERIALLTGDALIVAAFQAVTDAVDQIKHPDRMAQVLQVVAQGVAAPHGICAGQAWECEDRIDLAQYHRAKTGALFVAATRAGAAAAGANPEQWMTVGQCIGESYQVADDINDVTQDAVSIGKPCGKDEELGRPNAVREHGLDGAVARLRQLVESSVSSIPACPGRDGLAAVILEESKMFFPKNLSQRAA
jgi:geranylgeranyl diphosphate synthase type II